MQLVVFGIDGYCQCIISIIVYYWSGGWLVIGVDKVG